MNYLFYKYVYFRQSSKMKQLGFFLICLHGLTYVGAQTQESYDDSEGYYDSYSYEDSSFSDADTTSYYAEESNALEGFGDLGLEVSSDGESRPRTRVRVNHREIQKYVLPMDTVTGLITYLEVVQVKEQPDGESYPYQDSLYVRAKRWLSSMYNKKELKNMIQEEGIYPEGEGLYFVLKSNFPLVKQMNESVKENDGRIEFEMQVRFKDERYRYKIDNFVHVKIDGNGEADRIYLEYYKNAENNIALNNSVLIAVDEQIKKMVSNLKDYCAEPIWVDEDDW